MISENRKVSMTARMWMASIAFGVTATASLMGGYMNLKSDVTQLREGQEAAKVRGLTIEGQQLIQHDTILRMDAKLDYLIRSNRFVSPPRSDYQDGKEP